MTLFEQDRGDYVSKGRFSPTSYAGQRYIDLLDEFNKVAKKRSDFNKPNQHKPALNNQKQKDLQSLVQKHHGITSRRKLRDEDLIDRHKFNIGILKPNLEYLMEDNSKL